MPETNTLGSVDSELGQVVLGLETAANLPALVPTPALPSHQAPNFVAHVFSNDLSTFRRTLGRITNHLVLKSALNSFHQSVVIELEVKDTSSYGPIQGDVIRITMEGPNVDSRVRFTGIVERISDHYDDPPKYALSLTAIGAELADAPFDRAYVNTDVTQMIRDAIDVTTHLWYTNESLPSTGILKTATFSKTHALDVLDTARLMAGVNYFWFVDPFGCVWFRSFNTAAPSLVTLKQGADYTYRHLEADSAPLKNYVVAVGGVPAGGSVPVLSVYSDSTSQQQYGLKVLDPPYVFPQITDKPTLDAVVNTVGSALNRIVRTVEVKLPAWGSELLLGIGPGLTARYWEDSVAATGQVRTPGTGAYSPTYIVLEVHVDGPTQTVILGDVPYTAQDFKHMIDRIIQRNSVSALTYTPAALNVVGTFTSSGGLESSAVSGSSRWVLDGISLRASDGTTNNYGAPSGAGITVEIGANGSAFFSGTIKASTIIGTTISGSTITGGTISAPTIQGGQIQPTGGIPAAGTPYMLIDITNQQISVYDAAGVRRIVIGNY